MPDLLLRGLTGYVPVRDNFLLDYCAELAVQSLLPICDEVIVSVANSDSNDGTLEFFEAWAVTEPKLRVVPYEWPNPVGDKWFLVTWLNHIRQQCRYDTQITLDADEILDPESFPEIREALQDRRPRWFHRLNLWKSPEFEAPHGTVCAHQVVRMGPTELEMVSDGIYHGGDPEIRVKATHGAKLRVWHLGFLRDKRKFLKKARKELHYLLNTWDPRLQEAEDTGKDWVECAPFIDGNTGQERPLIRHGLKIPELARKWLLERGHISYENC